MNFNSGSNIRVATRTDFAQGEVDEDDILNEADDLFD